MSSALFHAVAWAAVVTGVHGELWVWPTLVQPCRLPHPLLVDIHPLSCIHCLNNLKAQLWLCHLPIYIHWPHPYSSSLSLCYHPRLDNGISIYFLGLIFTSFQSKALLCPKWYPYLTVFICILQRIWDTLCLLLACLSSHLCAGLNKPPASLFSFLILSILYHPA